MANSTNSDLLRELLEVVTEGLIRKVREGDDPKFFDAAIRLLKDNKVTAEEAADALKELQPSLPDLPQFSGDFVNGPAFPTSAVG